MKKILSIMLSLGLVFCISANVFAKYFSNNALNEQNKSRKDGWSFNIFK